MDDEPKRKLLVREITTCRQCSMVECNNAIEAQCGFNDKNIDMYYCSGTMPNWCPLEDADKSMYDKQKRTIFRLRQKNKLLQKRLNKEDK